MELTLCRGKLSCFSERGALPGPRSLHLLVWVRRRIRIVARNAGRAEVLKSDLKASAKTALQGFSWNEWPKAAAGSALLVNATSAGMRGQPSLTLSLDPLPRDAAVCDIVYNPLETQLLMEARTRGHVTIDGLGMLMHQAVPAFEAFYGVSPVGDARVRARNWKRRSMANGKLPLLVGLTGSIGMGKTETAKMFARLGIPVYDADAAVHALYEPGGAAVAEIAKEFPDSIKDGRVDRAVLTRHIAADRAVLKRTRADRASPRRTRTAQISKMPRAKRRGDRRAGYSAPV